MQCPFCLEIKLQSNFDIIIRNDSFFFWHTILLPVLEPIKNRNQDAGPFLIRDQDASDFGDSNQNGNFYLAHSSSDGFGHPLKQEIKMQDPF